MGVTAWLALVESPAVSSPVLHGLTRPRLLLPQGFASSFSPDELRHVLLHELAHVKRRDIVVSWAFALLQIIHWFNPLVWLGFARWRVDRELACDALALEVVGAERNIDYGRTILRLLQGSAPRVSAPGLIGILEDKSQLRHRLGMIASFRPQRGRGLLSLLALTAVGLACLTDAQVAKPKSEETPSPALASEKDNAVREVRIGADPALATDGTNAPTQSLTVTALDKTSGKPVAGAEVLFATSPFWRSDQTITEPRRLTDERGQYTLRIPLPSSDHRPLPGGFYITVRHSDYASRCATWRRSVSYGSDGRPLQPEISIFSKLPKEVSMRLDPGISIGGAVVDERGKPLAGVRVLVSRYEYVDFNRHSFFYSPEVTPQDKAKPAAVTDSRGRWTFSHFPSDLEPVQITFVRPDESSESFATVEGIGNHRTLVSFDKLADRTALFRLGNGVTVRGRVVDEKGKPLGGVLVKDGYGSGRVYRAAQVKTTRDGRFAFYHRTPRQWIYTASAEGRATVSLVAQVQPGMPEIRLVMPPAKPLKLRVVNDQNEPLAGVRISPVQYGNNAQILDWEGRTDAEGRVAWPNAPTIPVLLEATNPLGAKRFTAVATGLEKVIVLNEKPIQSITVQIRAIDSKTRLSVKIDAVLLESFLSSSEPLWLKAPGTNTFSVEIPKDWFRQSPNRLLLKAKGYEPHRSENIYFVYGNRELEVVMVPGVAINGVVKLPDGKPAGGAGVYARPGLDLPGSSLFNYSDGRLSHRQWWEAQIPDDGAFQLPDLGSNAPVVFKHYYGFLQTTVADLALMPEVRLHPWSRVEGQVTFDGQPLTGVTIHLSSLSADQSFHLSWSYRETESNGRFVFTAVPPGEYLISRNYTVRLNASTIPSHQMPVVVKPGETVNVDYHGNGRAVVGRLIADPTHAAVDWLRDAHVLTLKERNQPAINQEDFVSSAAYSEARWLVTPERLQRIREARNYELICERDGSFHIDDVPPGTYELRIKAGVSTSFPTGDQAEMIDGPALRFMAREVIIPKGSTPFNLGAIAVPTILPWQ